MIAPTEPSLTVLIVEDEQAIRRFVRVALEGEGYLDLKSFEINWLSS